MVIVDTHIIIWNALKPDSVSQNAREVIKLSNETDGLIICEISFWEIAMLINKERLSIPVPYLEFINLIKASNNYKNQGISPEIAEIAVQFPDEINQDPADRIISATSQFMNIPLITADKNLRKSKLINTIW